MIVVQYTDKPDDRLLKITYNHHKQSCKKFGYKYKVYQKPLDPNKNGYWQKPFVIQDVLRRGHENIVWLDTDALWLGKEHLLPEISSIGAVYLWNKSFGNPHHNNGVLYVNQNACESIEKWIEEPDDGRFGGDNYALSKLVSRGEIEITSIPFKWNSFVYAPMYYSKGDTVVAAWHGAKHKEQLMKEYFQSEICNAK